MNGPQDLGGQMGFGPVAPERDEPIFHAEWEKRALGVTLATGGFGAWNIDESRHARESLHPAIYYAATYYEIWIRALENLLKRHGFLSDADLAAGEAVDAAATPKCVLRAEDVAATLAKGGPCDRPVAGALLFKAGDRVRARNFNPTGHTQSNALFSSTPPRQKFSIPSRFVNQSQSFPAPRFSPSPYRTIPNGFDRRMS